MLLPLIVIEIYSSSFFTDTPTTQERCRVYQHLSINAFHTLHYELLPSFECRGQCPVSLSTRDKDFWNLFCPSCKFCRWGMTPSRWYTTSSDLTPELGFRPFQLILVSRRWCVWERVDFITAISCACFDACFLANACLPRSLLQLAYLRHCFFVVSESPAEVIPTNYFQDPSSYSSWTPGIVNLNRFYMNLLIPATTRLQVRASSLTLLNMWIKTIGVNNFWNRGRNSKNVVSKTMSGYLSQCRMCNFSGCGNHRLGSFFYNFFLSITSANNQSRLVIEFVVLLARQCHEIVHSWPWQSMHVWKIAVDDASIIKNSAQFNDKKRLNTTKICSPQQTGSTNGGKSVATSLSMAAANHVAFLESLLTGVKLGTVFLPLGAFGIFFMTRDRNHLRFNTTAISTFTLKTSRLSKHSVSVVMDLFVTLSGMHSSHVVYRTTKLSHKS